MAFERAQAERLRRENDMLREEIEILRRQISGVPATNPAFWSEDEERAAAALGAGALVLSSAQFDRLRDLSRRARRDEEASRRVWRLARKAMRKRGIVADDLECRLSGPVLSALASGSAENPKPVNVFVFMDALLMRVAELQFALCVGGKIVGDMPRDDSRGLVRVSRLELQDGRKVLSIRQFARGEDEWEWRSEPAGHVALAFDDIREFLTLLAESIETSQGGGSHWKGQGENVRLDWSAENGENYLTIQQFTAGSQYEDWMDVYPGSVRVRAREVERFVHLLLEGVEGGG